ncbi:MAG TPA: sialate O-acetylesterase [Prolixibacteraceae bacterium]|nr:sialate O-acetylesterase [Prolixibacteraceae bacterium]
MKTRFFPIVIVALSLFVYSCQTDVKKALKIPRLFSDHMVLQQNQKVNFWGQYTPEKDITITTDWGIEVSARADENGNWKIKLDTPAAGGPYEIKISSEDSTIVLKDVLIGEVWLASGQSNMDISLKGWLPEDTIQHSKQAIAAANYPDIRLLKVPFNISATPLDSLGAGKWIPASPETAGDFSAVAYFYALKLHQKLHVPIGIIQSSIGGTPAEAWTSKESLSELGDFNQSIDGLEKLQSTIANWFSKWTFQTVPRTDEEWKNLHLPDLAAFETDFDDSNWETMTLPGRFDRLSSGEFDGVMWIRKEFNIQDTTADFVLKIGSVDDMDETYINGQKVGGLIGSGFASTPREMVVSKSLLVKGSNTVAIRVIDSGGPGFVNGPITLSNTKDEMVSLEGDWKSRLVAENVSGKFYSYDLDASISERPNTSLLNSNSPTVLFNAMINPLVPYAIKGAIWYQGESNVGRAEQYKRIFPAMIEDWRNKWGYVFPFYYVQIAPYLYTDANQKDQSAKLRNAQRSALKLPKTGMVVTLDIGKLTSAHPSQKQEVGDRLARFALANEYGQKQVSSGPLYQQFERSGKDLIIAFDPASVGSGLLASTSGLSGFEIAGSDQVYFPAQAKIVNHTVVVSSSSVAVPEYVRYAWSDGFAATLFNQEGLPASTFSSEEQAEIF